jgi:hypothetical protein
MSDYLSNLSLLYEKHPEIGFQLTVQERVPQFVLAQEKAELFCQEAVEILYIYGVSSKLYTDAKQWLHADPGKKLVFLEDNLSAFHGFLRTIEAKEILSDAKVHFSFITDVESRQQLLEELAQSFPSDRIAFTASSEKLQNKTECQEIELTLKRNSAAFHALLSESLHSHKLFGNLLPNILRLGDSFYANKMKNQFKGVPAIICGAGPSLASAIPLLKTLENKALIIAGGSSLAALSNYHIAPHLGMALDPNHDEFLRLRPSTAFEVPLLYGNRLLPDVFMTCNGPFGYLKSDTGGVFEAYCEDHLKIEGEAIGPDLGREAFSVTTLGVALAYALGCDPIIFVGVDLAYTGKRRYAGGVVSESEEGLSHLNKEVRITEQLIQRKDIHGNDVDTALKWLMESSCIGSYAKQHPERVFLNATGGGLGFPNIKNVPFSETVEKYCKSSYDLRGKIHALSQSHRFGAPISIQMQKLKEDLHESLLRMKGMAVEMVEEMEKLVEQDGLYRESGKMALILHTFPEEMAYQALLFPTLPALDKILNRVAPLQSSQDTDRILLEREILKWKEMNSSIDSHIKTLELS